MCGLIYRVFVVLVLLTAPAAAATLRIAITDAGGKPVPNAVVTMTPEDASMPSRVPATARIDQRNETFVPEVVVVRQGGDVRFANSDPTMHQVYSFSAIKQFALEVDKGEASEPVSFDKSGIAAIGCNIHDKMLAHVVVTDAPLAVVTDANGRAEIRDVPNGRYRAVVWQKQLSGGKASEGTNVTVSGEIANFSQTLPIRLPSPNAAMRMHMDY